MLERTFVEMELSVVGDSKLTQDRDLVNACPALSDLALSVKPESGCTAELDLLVCCRNTHVCTLMGSLNGMIKKFLPRVLT